MHAKIMAAMGESDTMAPQEKGREWTRALLGVAAIVAMASPAVAQQISQGMYGVKIAVKDYQRAIDFYTTLGIRGTPMWLAAMAAEYVFR